MTALAVAASPAAGQESWPRSVASRDHVITLYQPQVESLVGDRLEARAAVSVRTVAGRGEPVYGAVWLSARVEFDTAARLVLVRELDVPQVRVAEEGTADAASLARLLQSELPTWSLTFDLDGLLADLDGDLGAPETEGLRHDPPRFILSTEPAILVRFDGPPLVQEVAGEPGLEQVVNTPFPIFRERGTPFYLSGGRGLWYAATSPTGPWSVVREAPRRIEALVEAAEAAAEEAGQGAQEEAPLDPSLPPPRIVTATEPTELIVTAGEPRWAPVEGFDLLYCENTDSDLFLEISTQRYYLLAAGRWYAGRSVMDELSWSHVPNDQLPPAFREIPEASVNGSVLAHVTGTPQAREEALENAIPEMVSIRRDAPAPSIEYDGEARFEPVSRAGSVRWAVNTASAVFKVGHEYFACEDGIWYRSLSPLGPWAVAVFVPDVLYAIPPSNPHHGVVYVRIYDVTPLLVYVGYTPGYLGSYWYRGCVVWGTGWRYAPWHGRHHHYSRPWTWGLHVRYVPWSGWRFGLTWTDGWFAFLPWTFWHHDHHLYHHRPRWHHDRGGWFGSGGYAPCRRPYPRPGQRKPRPVAYPSPAPAPRSPPIVPSPSIPPDYRRGGGDLGRPSPYVRPDVRDRLAPSEPPPRERVRPAPAPAPNDVLTDRRGNVYRRDVGGLWQRRQRGTWRPATDLDRPVSPARPGVLRPTPSRPWTEPARGRPRAEAPRTPSRRRTPTALPPHAPGRAPAPAVVPRPTIRPAPSGALRPQLERDWSARQRGAQRSQVLSRQNAPRRPVVTPPQRPPRPQVRPQPRPEPRAIRKAAPAPKKKGKGSKGR